MDALEDLDGPDGTAVRAHYQVSAIDAHASLAEQIWATLRRLGVSSGQMLVHGLDADAFTGAPLADPGSRTQDVTELIAQIPSTPSWPHQGLVVRPYSGRYMGQYDVVIGNLPYSDVRFTDPGNRARVLRLHETLILSSVAATLPGGITAVVTTHDVLDNEAADARDRIAQDADLVGAVRLPSASLRDTDHTDQVADLLLLRRRTRGQTTDRSTPFHAAVPTKLDGHTLLGNEYWTSHPDHIIGHPTAHPAPSGGAELQVTFQGEPLHDRLGTVLDGITHEADNRGLRVTSAPARARSGPPTTGVGAVVRQSAPATTGSAPAPRPPDAGLGTEPQIDL